MAGNFTAQVSGFASRTKERIKAVRDQSAQAVFEIANEPRQTGGNLPFQWGYLRASVVATTGEPNFKVTHPPKDAGPIAYDPSQVLLTIINASLNDTISIVWTSVYAMRMEYGFVGVDSLGRKYNQQGFRFVGLASQQWQRIVSETNAKLNASGK